MINDQSLRYILSLMQNATMISPAEYAEMEMDVRNYDQLRRYISDLISKANADYKNGIIPINVCDLVAKGLRKTKEESNERREYNKWQLKAQANADYSSALNEIYRKVSNA